MSHYGITPNDLKFQQNKIDKQIDYLSSNSYLTANGQYKTFLDISMSANISSRYYAQLVNKVNTLQQIMQNEDLIPIFITQTLDGWLHALLNADYRPLYMKLLKIQSNDKLTLREKKKERKKVFASIPKYILEKIQARESLDVKDLYAVLRHQWTNFQKSHAHQQMKKEGFKTGYLYVVEPHESGVPHAHVLLYIPEIFKDKLKEEFENKCPAPRNCSNDKLPKSQKKNGETNGFQWTLSNPVGYVMKYCVKSFMDVKNNNELDELQAWYIKHKIRRISMSHTLVPQWVYQKIYPLESCWTYLSTLKLHSTCEWSREDDYFQLVDDNSNKIFRYEKGLYQLLIDGEVKDEFGQKRETIEKKEYQAPKLTLKSKRPKIPYHHKLTINGEEYRYFVAKKFYQSVIKIPVTPSELSDFELFNYFYSKTIQNKSGVHYAITHNELVKRGLLKGNKLSLNEVHEIF